LELWSNKKFADYQSDYQCISQNTTIYYITATYIINSCVLTDILYSYILDKHIGMTNIK